MNDIDDLPGQGKDSDWRLLGELELPAGIDLDGALRSWLAELFAPLALREDFRNRFLNSARDAAARAFREDAGRLPDHIHLVIHVPRDRQARQGTWGFFHVEKLVHAAAEPSPVTHSVEFYLYVEGQT